MAFPVVESTNNWNSGTTSATSHNVALPSGITSGDLLILIYRTSTASSTTVATPLGWNIVVEEGNGGSFPYIVFSKISDGTEGATVTITQNNSLRASSNTYRISGTTGQTEGLIVGGEDPPSLTPTFGLDDYLWITIYSTVGTAADPATPTNYDNLVASKTVSSSSLNSNNQTYSADRELKTSSENPDDWIPTTSRSAILSGTLAIRGISGFNPAIGRRRLLIQ